MARTNSERIVAMETEVKNVNEVLKQHVEEQREDFQRLHDKLDDMKSSFAGKWVEKVLIGVVITVFGAAITLALSMG